MEWIAPVVFMSIVAVYITVMMIIIAKDRKKESENKSEVLEDPIPARRLVVNAHDVIPVTIVSDEVGHLFFDPPLKKSWTPLRRHQHMAPSIAIAIELLTMKGKFA